MKLALLICVLISSCLAGKSKSLFGATYDVKVKGTLTCSAPFKYAVLFEELDREWSNDRIDAINTTFSEQPSVYYEVKGEAADPEPLQDEVELRVVFYHNCEGEDSCVCAQWDFVSHNKDETLNVNLANPDPSSVRRCVACNRFYNMDEVNLTE